MILLIAQTPASAYRLAPLDLVIIGGYFLLVAGIGWWVWRRTKTGEDLFLAGRSLTWGIVGLSLFASNISSTSLIGLAGTAYTTGIVVANYEWMAAFILVFMCFTTIPVFLRSRIRTIPEYLEKRFDHRSRRYFSGLNVFLILFVDTAGGLYAGAIVMKLFFPQAEVWQLCLIIAVLAGFYTAAGGLRAVAITDALQAVVLLVGSVAVTYAVLAAINFDIAGALRELPSEQLSLIRPLDDAFLPWTGTLIGVPLIGFYFWSTNQFITQRILGAKNVTHARKGALLAGFLKLLPLFIMIIPGAFALLLFPDLTSGDLVFPTLIVELLPVGMVGLVVAALIAAVMSSVDSSLNSASTLIALDFVVPRKPHLSERQLARLGRWLTLGFMLFAAIWAPLIQQFPGLWFYLQAVLSYSVPPVVVLFLGGIFWKKASRQGALYGMLGAHAVAIVLFLFEVFGLVSLHFTYVAGILFAVAAGLLVVLSLRFPDPSAVVNGRDPALTFSGIRQLEKAERTEALSKRWADYRTWSVLLIAVTCVIVIYFW